MHMDIILASTSAVSKASAEAETVRIKTDAALNTNFAVSYLSPFYTPHQLLLLGWSAADTSASQVLGFHSLMRNIVINVSEEVAVAFRDIPESMLHLFVIQYRAQVAYSRCLCEIFPPWKSTAQRS